jgi:Asp-tRNA(Asn)/Glu-tRNA(Gln) amidotransferase A subunit family amidase
LPVGKDPTGLPIGMQLSMASGTDDRLMTIACAAERILGTPSAILGDPTLAT